MPLSSQERKNFVQLAKKSEMPIVINIDTYNNDSRVKDFSIQTTHYTELAKLVSDLLNENVAVYLVDDSQGANVGAFKNLYPKNNNFEVGFDKNLIKIFERNFSRTIKPFQEKIICLGLSEEGAKERKILPGLQNATL